MRTRNTYIVAVLWLVMVWTALAQTNAPAFDPKVADLPVTRDQFWMYGIALITPVIVWAFGKIPTLPRPVLPLLAPLTGLLIGFALQKLGALHLTWWDGAKAGTVAVFIRESVNQLVTKQLFPLEGSKTSANPTDTAVAVPANTVTEEQARPTLNSDKPSNQ
jgi:hypothetical protein